MIVLTILLWCLGIIAGIVLILVVSPFQARLQSAFDGAFSGTAEFSFIHPAILRVFTDFTTGTLQIRVFGWQPGVKKRTRKKQPQKGQREKRESATVYHPPEQSQSETKKTESVMAPSEPVDEKSGVEPPPETVESDNVFLVDADDPDIKKEAFSEQPSESAPEVETITSSAPSLATHRLKGASNNQAETTTDTLRQHGFDEPSAKKKNSESDDMKENVAPKRKKKDNWIEKLKQSIVVQFLADRKWRSGVLHWLIRFLRSLFFIVRFDRFRLQVTAGVEDPMLTGSVSGVAHALQSVLQGKDRYLFSFEPVFMRNSFAGSLQLRVRTSLLWLLTPLLMALVTFPLIRTLVLLVRYWWRKRKHRQRMAVA